MFLQDVFSNPECLSLAMSTYHPRESPSAASFASSGLSRREWWLSMRAVASKSFTHWKNDESGILSEGFNPKFGVGETMKPYHPKDTRALFNLATLKSEWDAQTVLFKAFVACFFVRCLRRSNYFPEDEEDERESDLLIGSLFSHFMEVSTLNAHEIAVCGEGQVVRDIGQAVEPTFVLMNHACDPAIIKVGSYSNRFYLFTVGSSLNFRSMLEVQPPLSRPETSRRGRRSPTVTSQWV